MDTLGNVVNCVIWAVLEAVCIVQNMGKLDIHPTVTSKPLGAYDTPVTKMPSKVPPADVAVTRQASATSTSATGDVGGSQGRISSLSSNTGLREVQKLRLTRSAKVESC